MNYIPLSKLYYKTEVYREESAKRRNGYATMLLPCQIAGKNAYLVPNFEIMYLLQEIFHRNNKLQAIKYRLPGVAVSFMIKECLSKEIILTNDIEGVQSTRKEINTIISAKIEEKTKRLFGMVRKYQRLIEDDLNVNEYFTVQGLRTLYDEIVASEIPDNEQPDGRYFRKDSNEVVSVTGKVKHQGLFPEEKIIQGIGILEDIILDDKIPGLIRIALSHYLIGYIHPFYNGNGRINRFISSCLLRQQLGKIPAIYLSRAVKNRLADYYRAFDLGNDRKNDGDITPFVIIFLELIRDAVSLAEEEFGEGLEKLNYFSNLIDLPNILDKEESSLLFYLIQFQLFAPEEKFNETQVSYIGSYTRYSLVEISERLLKKEVPLQIVKAGRAKIYQIDLDLLEEWAKARRA